MTTTAERPSVPQHLRALARANEIRLHQVGMKRKVRDGELSVADAFEDPRMGSMAIGSLLVAQKRWGVYRTRKFMLRIGISERRRVDQLTEREQELIVRVLTRGW